MSYATYARTQEMTEAPRQTEARALALVTGMLVDARDKGHRAVIEACHKNRQLWSVFQSDLIHPDNSLPDHVKAQLISLSIFVQRHTAQVINRRGSIDILIELNREIMNGLTRADDPDTGASQPATETAVAAI